MEFSKIDQNDRKVPTRQPSAAAEARQISGAQGWEGEGVRGQSPPPPCWGWPGRGGWVGGLEGFWFREGDRCVASGGNGTVDWRRKCCVQTDLLTRGTLSMEWEAFYK